MLNVAATLPQVLAPGVAAPVVVLAGYPLLFAIAGVATAAEGVLVHRIRSVA